MAKRLKVYGGMVMRLTGQHRAVIAAHNASEVAAAIGNATAHYVRGYWCVTGNENEIQIAMANPGKLMLQIDRHSEQFTIDNKS